MADPVIDRSRADMVVDESGGDVPSEIEFINAVFRRTALNFRSCGGNDMEGCKLLFVSSTEEDGSFPDTNHPETLLYVGIHLETSGDLEAGFYEGWIELHFNRARLFRVEEAPPNNLQTAPETSTVTTASPQIELIGENKPLSEEEWQKLESLTNVYRTKRLLQELHRTQNKPIIAYRFVKHSQIVTINMKLKKLGLKFNITNTSRGTHGIHYSERLYYIERVQ